MVLAFREKIRIEAEYIRYLNLNQALGPQSEKLKPKLLID